MADKPFSIRLLIDTTARFAIENAWQLIYAGGTLMLGGFAALFASYDPLAKPWTRLDYMVVTIGFAICIVVFAGCIGWARRYFREQESEGQLSFLSKASNRPVRFLIIADHYGEQFRNKPISSNAGEKKTCEETFSVIIEATKNLTNVVVRARIYDPMDGDIGPFTCLKDEFSGAVPRSKTAELKLIRRQFYLKKTAERQKFRFTESPALVRVDELVEILPDDREHQGKLDQNCRIEIEVLHDEGPDRCGFAFDFNLEEATRTRVSWMQGNLFIADGYGTVRSASGLINYLPD